MKTTPNHVIFIQIIEGSASPSPGFTKVPVDLNQATSGAVPLLSKSKALAHSAVPLFSRSKTLSHGAVPIVGKAAATLYLCYTKSGNQQPLTAVEVIQGKTSDVWPAEHPETVRIDVDCNKGAGGRFVYICYRRC